VRSFFATIRERLLQRHFIVSAIVFFALGAASAFAFKQWIPLRPEAPPLAAIAATTVLLLLIQAATLAFLGLESAASQRWTAALAFIQSSLLTLLSYAGIALAGVVSSLSVLIPAAWVTVAFAAILCALFGLFHLLLERKTLVLQIVLSLAVLLNSALFWSRAIITDSGVQGMADGVMKFSPPLALAAAWHQEGHSRHGAREDSRFDIIRSPLTYDIWVGSYQAVPYPPIYPESKDGEPFQPGILMVLLLWGIPVLITAEVLRKKDSALSAAQ
jgi:hypothetical protein